MLPTAEEYVSTAWGIGPMMGTYDLDKTIGDYNTGVVFELQGDVTQEMRITTMIAIIGAMYFDDELGAVRLIYNRLGRQGAT